MKRFGFTVLLAAVGAAALAPGARAATINVNSLSDAGVPGCELREAIDAANTNAASGGCTAGSGPDTINITAAGPITLNDANGELPVTSVVDVVGLGEATTTVRQSGVTRIFHVEPGGDLGLAEMTVSEGVLQGDGPAVLNEGVFSADDVTFTNNQSIGDDGGAIAGHRNSSTTLIDSVVRDNVAGAGGGDGDGNGGGIYVEGGTLLVQRSLIEGNTALENNAMGATEGSGGGIAARPATVPTVSPSVTISSSQIGSAAENNVAQIDGGGVDVVDGSLVVTNSLVMENQADGLALGSGDGAGSGIRITDSSATAHPHRIVDSRIAGNNGPVGTGGGGGLFSALFIPQALEISGTTFSANSAFAGGGAIFFGRTTITNSTFSGNIAENGGGAITLNSQTPPQATNVTIRHTTIAGNQAAPGLGAIFFGGDVLTLGSTLLSNPAGGGDCQAPLVPITSAGYNVWSDGSCALAGPGDLAMTDPMLAALADNGGPHAGVPPGVPITTHEPMAASPAIDHSPIAPATDQRGVVRPQGASCDSGSVERAAAPVPGAGCPAARAAPAAPASGSPDNSFSFGKVERKKKKGIAFLTVIVPGLGEVGLTGKGAAIVAGARAARTVDAAGPVRLKIKPAKGKAGRKVRNRLERRGKAKLRVQVTFVPAGGSANTQATKVKLIRK